MKKKSPTTPTAPAEDSSFMHKAGELLHSIGSHIVDAKDVVVDSVAKEIKVVKKAIKKKKLAKKKAAVPKKPVKKAASKKTAKKPPAKKTVSKFARKAKKAAKKSASNRMKK